MEFIYHFLLGQSTFFELSEKTVRGYINTFWNSTQCFISSVFPKWFENTINVIENLMKISLSFKLILLKTQHFKWYLTPNQHISMKVLISNGHMYVPCIKFSCSEFLTKRLNISFLILMHVWTRRFNIIAFVMLWGFGPYWNEISEDSL